MNDRFNPVDSTLPDLMAQRPPVTLGMPLPRLDGPAKVSGRAR